MNNDLKQIYIIFNNNKISPESKYQIKQVKSGKNNVCLAFYSKERPSGQGMFKRSDGVRLEKNDKISKVYLLSTKEIKEININEWAWLMGEDYY